ncbi:PadR family transcriptional regulator [Ruminococcaceae bacterium OttesenSCG-928-A11]|nr:PadR family transcriptional regulator [Ruminococcaceae bacterium OttesenSCG-928-A11]
MTFNTGAALLDALVLSVVNQSDTYGYKITQDVRSVVDVSESTLYPVLRRLQKDGYLAAYDQAYAGRNRRYYTITPQGQGQLELCRSEWRGYSKRIENLLFGGINDEQN